MSLLLDLLGRKYDKEGRKANSFSSQVTTLGVVVNVELTNQGLLEILRNAKRVRSLGGPMQHLMLDVWTGGMPKSYNVVGRLLAFLKFSGHQEDWLYSTPHGMLCTFCFQNFEHVQTLKFLRKRLDNNDACESIWMLGTILLSLQMLPLNKTTVAVLGGVLLDNNGLLVSWFRVKLPSEQVKKVMRPDQSVAIAELETSPLLVALNVWRKDVSSRHVLCCLDNEVARFSLIQGYSQNDMVSCLAQCIFLLCESMVIMPWYLRVPSASNIAHLPSRWMHHPFLEKRQMISDEVASVVTSHVLSETLLRPEWTGGQRGLSAGVAECCHNSNLI